MIERQKHIRHYHRHFGFSYPVSLAQKLYSILLGPLIVVLVMAVFIRFFAVVYPAQQISFSTLILATLATLSRLFIAYIISVIVAVPLALFITWKPSLETIFLPIFDILESIPILAFFPVVLLVFLKFNFLTGAAIFIIFLDMVWNILFTLIGGLKIIPHDIIDAAKVFNIKGFRYFRKVLFPAIIPQLVTGSIIAVAQGWNIIIIAEVLHVYLPQGSNAQDLFGIGSILVQASGAGNTSIFLMALLVMVLTIAFFNFFVWQKLLHYAQRYRFE
jgi:NitT/TauT family transport system permease protein